MLYKEFRNNGAIGALLDEYERAILELSEVLEIVSNSDLLEIVDLKTVNPDCQSIQTVLSHVIRAGRWYNIEIRKSLGENLDNPQLIKYDLTSMYQAKLIEMFHSTEQIFQDYPNVDIYSIRSFRWKQVSNIDILLEHTIVHILRHRRQIEKFILEINNRKDS